MNLLKRFIIKQVILAAVSLGVLFFLVCFIFGGYLNHSSQQKVASINQMLADHSSANPKMLARQLNHSFVFETLKITTLGGTVLYDDQQFPADTSLSHDLLNSLSLLPTTYSASNHQLDIELTYKLDWKAELALFSDIVMALLFVVLTSSVISLFVINRTLNDTLDHISRRINRYIEHIFNEPGSDADADWQNGSKVLPTVTQTLQDLQWSINKQIMELRSSAKLLKQEDITDDLTGLPNRNLFLSLFEKRLNEKNRPVSGCLAIVRCSELEQINQNRGFKEADNYIKHVVTIIKHCADAFNKPSVFRLNGADFAIILPNITLKQTEVFAAQLQAKFNDYQRTAGLNSVAYTGIVNYKATKPPAELLALADAAVSIAQTKQTNGWHSQKNADPLGHTNASYDHQTWCQVIEQVIENKGVALFHQPIAPCNSNTEIYHEVLTRFVTNENHSLPTTSFLAMAEKLDKMTQLDRVIIEKAFEIIALQNENKQVYGINIAPKSINDESFVRWLEQVLQKNSALACRLVFEISEFGLQQNIDTSKRFIKMIHRVGARVAVEKFGTGLTSFKFFRDLHPDFVKMDGSYTTNIASDKNNQYFLKLIIDLTHRIGICVFAQSVETKVEKQMLEKLFIDGVQGHYIEKPKPF